MLAQIRARASHIPRRAWVIAGGALVVAIVAAAIMIIFDPLAGPFVTLDERRPVVAHPDGIVISLAEGSLPVLAQVKTIPREAFLADEAGGDWATARQALPQTLSPLSPIYVVKLRGDGDAVASVAVPNDAEPLELVDLFSWDTEAGRWVFVPSILDPASQTIRFVPLKPQSQVMVFRAKPGSLTAGVVISPGGPDLGANYGLGMPEGLTLGLQGELGGAPATATGSTILPVVGSHAGFAQYADEGSRGQVIALLMDTIRTADGLVIDFDPAAGFETFVQELANEAHSHGKRLDVVVHGPALDRYDLATLGQAADRVWVAPGDDPNLYLPSGGGPALLAQAVGSVDRRKLGLWVNALNVEVVGGQATPVSVEQSLAAFGGIEPIEGYNNLLSPGDNLAVKLSGGATSIGFDPSLGMNYVTDIDAQGQLRYTYFASAANLSRRLEWARVYGLSAVAVVGIAHPEASPRVSDGLAAFINQQPMGDPAPIQLEWNVTGAGGELNRQSGDLGLIQYLWQAAVEPGQYVINALVPGTGKEGPVSTLVVEVGQQSAGLSPTPNGTPTPTVKVPATPTQSTGAPTPQSTAPPVTGSIVAGSFELGGQVQDGLANAAKMQQAGMTWVKFQHKWSPGEGASVVADKINAAHSAGFKVLLSIPGQQPVTSIDYAGYANFLSGVAALGPDAIEVWNEMNFDREWPVAELGGGNYVTKMLAPAFNAIKNANPNVLVISGAPTPTGAFPPGCGFSDLAKENGCNDYEYLAQMRDAGGANYADCVGVHFNSGATSPAATTGHPNDGGDHHYSWYYQPMVNLYLGTLGKPLCFTELGYAAAQGVGSAPGGFPWANSVTVADQAQWLAETAVLASQSGKVRLMIIWNVDYTGGGSDPKGMYAIIRPDGTCPACEALQNVKP